MGGEVRVKAGRLAAELFVAGSVSDDDDLDGGGGGGEGESGEKL